MVDIENQSRKKIIFIDEIAREKGENWGKLRKKVQQMVINNLGLVDMNMEIKRARKISWFQAEASKGKQ